MTKADIVILMLRQPRMKCSKEKRSDPFYEFGSFGCTGCHEQILRNPDRAFALEGKRLAFAQGGPGDVRLVYLTPPVSVVRHSIRCELKWTPGEMPLKFTDAPVIISNRGQSDTPAVFGEVSDVNRRTWVTKFSSKFRNSKTPVAPEFAQQLDKVYAARRSNQQTIAQSYDCSLPRSPPLIDHERYTTYSKLRDQC